MCLVKNFGELFVWIARIRVEDVKWFDLIPRKRANDVELQQRAHSPSRCRGTAGFACSAKFFKEGAQNSI